MSDPPPKLEVEDDEDRQNRIATLLEKTNAPPKYTRADTTSLQFNVDGRKTLEPDSSNELLARVRTFLPQIEADNALLAQRVQTDPRSVDIEDIEDADRIIEMNLGLGVFDVRGEGPQEPHNYSSSSEDSEGEESEEQSDGDSDESQYQDEDSELDTSSSSEGHSSQQPSLISRPMKPLPRRTQKPKIEVL